jgi:Mg2+ and Co2+ transporter CorA
MLTSAQAYHLIAQRESRLLLEITQNSRSDNKHMRSIAAVGLVYLPATFVSGLFGMNFFEFKTDEEKQVWVVSDKFWVFWVVAGILTGTTCVMWIGWDVMCEAVGRCLKGQRQHGDDSEDGVCTRWG